MGSTQQSGAPLPSQRPQLLLGAMGPACPGHCWEQAYGFNHHLQTKELFPERGHRGCTELWIGFLSHLQLNTIQPKLNPKLDSAALRGLLSITSHGVWFFCQSSSEKKTRSPRYTQPATAFTGTEASTDTLLSPAFGGSSKCLLYFPQASECRSAKSCPSNRCLRSAPYSFLTVIKIAERVQYKDPNFRKANQQRIKS